ncbi:MAG TPA: FAD-dependent oxidoreductase [Microbacteriaceae bacterium]|nr:FAD-dependent oxidoreductase [Microbacteriaceae bacterium]
MVGVEDTQIAVIGSGPAGCYLTQSLLRALPNAQITVFDRLASPFGLIRYGIATDHQHTKAITRQFDRMFADPRVRFAGNVRIGEDIGLEDIQKNFDKVVLATGLTSDRKLSLPGDSLPGVYGAGEITRILNSHPGAPKTLPEFGKRTVIIGGGNVAIDLLRFLVKDEHGFEASDITDQVLEAYLANPVQHITLAQRSQPANSKADAQMLKELATLNRATYSTQNKLEATEDFDRAQAARVNAFAAMVQEDREITGGPDVELAFGHVPLRVLGETKVEGVEFAIGDDVVVIEADSVITAIGFNAMAEELADLTASPSESGRIAEGLYRTGWARRGPQGAIPENRACAKLVADEIVQDLQSDTADSASRLGFNGLPEPVKQQSISFADWQKIDEHEKATAPDGRVRMKVSDHLEMVTIAGKQN